MRTCLASRDGAQRSAWNCPRRSAVHNDAVGARSASSVSVLGGGRAPGSMGRIGGIDCIRTQRNSRFWLAARGPLARLSHWDGPSTALPAASAPKRRSPSSWRADSPCRSSVHCGVERPRPRPSLRPPSGRLGSLETPPLGRERMSGATRRMSARTKRPRAARSPSPSERGRPHVREVVSPARWGRPRPDRGRTFARWGCPSV